VPIIILVLCLNYQRTKKYDFIRHIDKKYKNDKSRTLLDTACGYDGIDDMLKRKYKVTAIDSDKKSIKTAKKRVAGISFIVANMQKFNHTGKFDIIICIHGIDHGNELRHTLKRTLKHLNTQLNNGGILIFDLNFLKELWAQKITTTNIIQSGREKYVQVYHQEVEDNDGLSYYVTIRLKRNKLYTETSTVRRSLHLLNLKKVKRMVIESGFDAFLYDGWNPNILKKVGKNAPVFVCVKRK
jgi:SAM-dependent methyltransferase